jgi:hypothetical protein
MPCCMLRLLHMTTVLTLHALSMHCALLLVLQAARGLGRGKDFTFVTSDVAELVPVVKHMQQVCLYHHHLSYFCTLRISISCS